MDLIDNPMPQNIGPYEQAVRMLVGVAIFSLAFIGPQTIWAWLGAVVVFFAAWGWCPMYAILGIKTCDDPEKQSS